MAPRLSAMDKEWQRENDARTLAEAEVIKSTPARLKGAVTEAKKMAKKSEQDVKAMKRVASRSNPVVRVNKKTPLTRATKKRK